MSTDYNEYFKHYINLVASMQPMEALIETHEEFITLVNRIDEEKGIFRYEATKCTVKEVISHIIDAERVFAYRALSFARRDETNLAGFDDQLYAQNSCANSRLVMALTEEFDLIRQSSIALFKSFDEDMLKRQGTANSIEIDVKSLAYLIAGHCRHHGNILEDLYDV